MEKLSKIRIFFILMFCALLTGGAGTKEREKEYKFVESVILGTEYGASESVVHRWRKRPEVSLFFASEEEDAIVREWAETLNELLKPAKFGVKIAAPNKNNSNFKVYFVSRNDFPAIAAEHRFEYIPGNAGFFNVWWNLGNEINRAVVLIDKHLKGWKKRHYSYEEMTQALGLANDSPYYSQSIFYERGRNTGMAQDFSALDRTLILFFYQHTKPGFSAEQVRENFEHYWG